MTGILENFNRQSARKDMPNIRPGHVVKVYQKIKETEKVAGRSKGKSKSVTKERIQLFEGLVIAMKGRQGVDAAITVRKISNGVGVERIFPLSAPTIEKIELIKKTKARRAKLYYMRDRIGKATRPKGELIKPEENKVSAKEEVKKATENEEEKEAKDKEEKETEVEEKEIKEEVKEEETKKDENNKEKSETED